MPLQGWHRYKESNHRCPPILPLFAVGVTRSADAEVQPRRAGSVSVESGSVTLTSEVIVTPLGVANTVVCGT
jgi:hypothetical protein